jgi:hypothetical protein
MFSVHLSIQRSSLSYFLLANAEVLKKYIKYHWLSVQMKYKESAE